MSYTCALIFLLANSISCSGKLFVCGEFLLASFMEKWNSKKDENTHKQLFRQRGTSHKEATLPHSCFKQAIIIMRKQHMRFKPRKRREDSSHLLCPREAE